jgi:hypothetical protein
VPGRRTTPTSVVAAMALGLALALGGCSEASPSATSTPLVKASPLFSTLLPTVLPPVPPFAYAESSAAQRALEQGRVDSVLSAFSGGVSRDLVLDGRVVGGVLFYRFVPEVATSERVHFPPMIVYTFAGASPHQGKVGGQVVQRVDRTADGRTVIGWTHEDYVVVVWTHDLRLATTYAGDYILRSM